MKGFSALLQALQGSRSMPWWFLLGIAPLWLDHLGVIEIDAIAREPVSAVGILGLLGAINAAIRQSNARRSDDPPPDVTTK